MEETAEGHGLSELPQPCRDVLGRGGAEGRTALPLDKAGRDLSGDLLARDRGGHRRAGARLAPARDQARRARRPSLGEPAGMDHRRSRHHVRGCDHGARLHDQHHRRSPPHPCQQRGADGDRLHECPRRARPAGRGPSHLDRAHHHDRATDERPSLAPRDPRLGRRDGGRQVGT